MVERALQNVARAPSIPHWCHVHLRRLHSSFAPPAAVGRSGLGPSVTRRLRHTYARFPGDPHAELDHPDPDRPPYTPPKVPPRRVAPAKRRVVLSQAAPRLNFEAPLPITRRVDTTMHPWWVSKPIEWDKLWSDMSWARLNYLRRLSHADRRRLSRSENVNEQQRMRLATWVERLRKIAIIWLVVLLLYAVPGGMPVLGWARYPSWLRRLSRQIWEGNRDNYHHMAQQFDELLKNVPEGIQRTKFKLKLLNDFLAACERVEKRGITSNEWAALKPLKLDVKDVVSGRFERELDRLQDHAHSQAVVSTPA